MKPEPIRSVTGWIVAWLNMFFACYQMGYGDFSAMAMHMALYFIIVDRLCKASKEPTT